MLTNISNINYSDEDFLTTILNAIQFLSIAAPQQMLAIKNRNFEHIFCSNYLLQLMGKSMAEVFGKRTCLSLYDNEIDLEAVLAQEDQLVIDGRNPKTLLKINKFSIGLVPYLCIKSPIINPNTNNIVGILFQGFGIGSVNLDHYLKKSLLSLNNPPDTSNQLPILSKREKQVIFFFLAHLSSQEIAEALYKIEGKKLSKSTIDSIFNDQLYIKFNVYSRPALYKRLQEMGYEQKIPRELLSSASIILDVFNIY